MSRISLFIVDDHQIIIDGLKGLFGPLEDFIICGEANDIESATNGILNLKPDIALVDIRMPNGTEGLKLLQWVVKNKLDTKVVLLSMHHEVRLIQDAKNWGAKGYLLKNTGKDELFHALRFIVEGGVYFYEAKEEKQQQEVVFTPKELEVIRLIVDGYSSSEISQKLSISDETVKVHRRNIRNKTGATNTVELINKLVELGFPY